MTKKKILSIFLALLFMLSAVPVFTADDDGGISLYSRGVASASAALSVSGSTASCTGEADAASDKKENIEYFSGSVVYAQRCACVYG